MSRRVGEKRRVGERPVEFRVDQKSQLAERPRELLLVLSRLCKPSGL